MTLLEDDVEDLEGGLLALQDEVEEVETDINQHDDRLNIMEQEINDNGNDIDGKSNKCRVRRKLTTTIFILSHHCDSRIFLVKFVTLTLW